MKTLLKTGAALSVIASVWSTTALAQVDEIIVSAERRQESIQDVPIAVTAFQPQDLEERQITEPLDLINYVPNVYGSNNTGLGT
ncbi:MAG: hypothetical protein K2Q06_02905, partial [Parvularculaceae bacterium]|nr:hypothetical protein [Parvularculaceae bacterium]